MSETKMMPTRGRRRSQRGGKKRKQMVAPADASPELRHWYANAYALSAHKALSYRGCLGLGVVMTANGLNRLDFGDRLLVPNNELAWAVVVDIPTDFQLYARHWHIQWGTLRGAVVRNGMVSLDRGAEGSCAWDLRLPPSPAKPYAIAETTKCPRTDVQTLRVFNAINTAMTSTAAVCSRHVQEAREEILKRLGLPDKHVRYGGGDKPATKKNMPFPTAWAPRPYLAFDRDDITAACARTFCISQGGGWDCPYPFQEAMAEAYRDGFPYVAPRGGRLVSMDRAKFIGYGIVRALVLRFDGDTTDTIIAAPLDAVPHVPETFVRGEKLFSDTTYLPNRSWSTNRAWSELRRRLGGRLRGYAEMWWHRQALVSDDTVYVPAALCSEETRAMSIDAELRWDVLPAQEYLDPACDAFIFPPIGLPNWRQLHGELPGGVQCDFRPAHEGFIEKRPS